ncbi:MAG: hypothetical protein OEY55_10235 [Acidimicrobiia bacterium]|nr:hypothetical protein [Acidimicrobiia bacterium]MDH5502575.1 hypothetical protein [Acidimicrobiia bacterium]
MKFVQTIIVRTRDQDGLADLMAAWHATEAGNAPGYLGSRLLADRESPDRYQLIIDFASAEEAHLNNDRVETQTWAAKLSELIDGDPEFGNFDDIQTIA